MSRTLIRQLASNKFPQVLSPFSRTLASAKSFDQSNVQVVFSDDGNTIVCYHPEPTFPYEHSRVLPKIECKFKEEDSAIKVSLRENSLEMFEKEDYSMEELVRLTHVSELQWRWLPDISRKSVMKKEIRKNIWDKQDREGI